MRITRGIASLTVAGLALTGLAACSSDDADTETTATATTDAAEETTEATDEPSEEPTETEDATDEPTDDASEDSDDSASGSGDSPAWAVPTTTPGDQIATIDGDTFTVDVYQVGTAPASKTGQWVDPDSNEPLIAEGDEIVYVNYVFTNTGSEPIPLTYSLVTVTPTYADWEYLQGMDSIVDSEQFTEMDVTSFAIDPMSGEEAPFEWAPGQTFSYGQNFKYQAGSPITFEARLSPADDAGEPLSDERTEVSVDATIS
ncbi:hypothetical protein Sked_01510 [Sanguibacter keddieii DSM 10542]|uniref:DUF4352 domain-containing protein n=1 Tax=Sanguibacter keddieii (strain ATCC 51767 / DSM 10542 / NCFB 3025 / ST-74) TaxID=446469 RepID=D1BIT1_SANKS|nr:hypothetical protein [Sanguibacter keddieii]ACZ20123.1 hypothetical protein Sked_01510 [Sanguibacter keddieii DSM 10542]